jgi:hypothetical protein
VAKKRQRKARAGSAGLLRPTPEREAQGLVELVERPIADDEGRVSRPLRAIDIRAAMQRRGAITAEMRQAGEDFRSSFRRAGLDPLQAQNLLRAASGGLADSMPVGLIAARQRVWRALAALGGINSAAGAYAWHALGGTLPANYLNVAETLAFGSINSDFVVM